MWCHLAFYGWTVRCMTTGTGALMALAGILASVLGVQTLVSSTPQPRAVLLLLPTGGILAGLGDGLRRGYLLAMEQSKACGVSPPELGLGWVRPGLDPQRSTEAGPPPSLLIAPPAAPLAPDGLLAERLRLPVLLPLQRGLSLQHLAAQPGSDRLWPVLPARSQAADQLALAEVERRWPQVMVIRDGSAEHRVLAERFVAGLSVAGGRLIGPANGTVRVDPSNVKAWSQFQTRWTGIGPRRWWCSPGPAAPWPRRSPPLGLRTRNGGGSWLRHRPVDRRSGGALGTRALRSGGTLQARRLGPGLARSTGNTVGSLPGPEATK